LEDSGLGHDVRDDHHPGEQEDHVEVDGREGVALVDQLQDDDHRGAQERRERAVDLLGDDERVGGEENPAGKKLVASHPPAPPYAWSSRSMRCTTRVAAPVRRRPAWICIRQPGLAVTTSVAPVRRMFVTLRSRTARASSGWVTL